MRGLDSTFLIDLLRGNEDATELAWLLDEDDLLLTTEINAFELYAGIYRGEIKDKEKRLVEVQSLFNKLVVLPFDHKSAVTAARIMGDLKDRGNDIGVLDVLIAATLLSQGCNTIVTRNRSHFEKVKGLKIEEY